MDGSEVLRRQPFGDNPQVGRRGSSTQRSILDAALQVFDRHGFHGARVELITEAAGCSRPAFYQYFSNKEDVFWHLAGHLARELRAAVDRLDQLTPDPAGVASLERWLGDLIGVYQAYRPVFASFRVAFREHGRSEPLPSTITDHLRDLLDGPEGAAASRPADVDPGVLAEATTATVLRSIHYSLLGLGRTTPERFRRGVACTVHRVAFGPIRDVNVDPLVGRPAAEIVAMPTLAGEHGGNGLPLRARGMRTRRQLLDAGGRVLPRRGYHDTRVDDIVAEAGVSHGSFYRYFDSKSGLFSVLALDAAEHMVGLIERCPAEAGAELRPWLREWFETYRAKGGVLSAWEEIGFEAPEVVSRSTDIASAFFDRLERLVSTRGFGDVPVDSLVLLAAIEDGPHSVLVLNRFEESQAIAAADHIIGQGVLGLGGAS